MWAISYCHWTILISNMHARRIRDVSLALAYKLQFERISKLHSATKKKHRRVQTNVAYFLYVRVIRAELSVPPHIFKQLLIVNESKKH